MDTSYKPTVTFPPKASGSTAPGTTFMKKRRLDEEGTYQPVKTPTTSQPRNPAKASRFLDTKKEPNKTTQNFPQKEGGDKWANKKTPALLSPPKDLELKKTTYPDKLQFQKDGYQNKNYNNYNKTSSYGYNKSYYKPRYGYNNNRGYNRGYRGNGYRGYNRGYYNNNRGHYNRGYRNNRGYYSCLLYTSPSPRD